MNQELVWIYVFNLIVNSFLAFLTMVVFVQLLSFFSGVNNNRLKVLLLCVPLIKLAMDPFLYNFQNWALAHQINPLQVETGYSKRSLVEATFSKLKRLYGGAFYSRKMDTQRVEGHLKCLMMNKMLQKMG